MTGSKLVEICSRAKRPALNQGLNTGSRQVFDVTSALAQGLNLEAIDVETDSPKALLRKTTGQRQSGITQAKDTNRRAAVSKSLNSFRCQIFHQSFTSIDLPRLGTSPVRWPIRLRFKAAWWTTEVASLQRCYRAASLG
jgi:hypothetical protein